MPTAADYLAFITSYHRGQPRFAATVGASVEPQVAAQEFLASIAGAFDLDAAAGAQEDILGLWIGRTRNVETPLVGVYFSFDTAGLGFDEGSWKGPYDPDAGLVALDDDTYRTLLRAKIAANNWDGTVPGAAAAIEPVFAGTGTLVFIQANQDMTMIIGLAGAYPTAVRRALLVGGYLPLKPAGVSVEYAITTADGAPVFGFDVENDFISGFDTGAWAATA